MLKSLQSTRLRLNWQSGIDLGSLCHWSHSFLLVKGKSALPWHILLMDIVKGLLTAPSLQWAAPTMWYPDHLLLSVGVFGSSAEFHWLPPEVMNLLNKCVLSGEQVSSQSPAQPLKASVVIAPWCVSVCVGTHVWSFRWALEAGKRGRSIFMSGFLRFYFIFISFPWSTYAFWCLKPHDFAFISG